MGFLSVEPGPSVQTTIKGVNIKTLHEGQCSICPLRDQPVKHQGMEPYGSTRPLIYILGEAPGADEDKLGKPFVGPAGRVLRYRIPKEFEDRIRWNNCVRTRPPGNRNPTQVELECCRPSIVSDIENTKPKAIFGFGNVPLQWALNQSGISKWTGRRIPVQIGNHVCWFYPMLHPSYVRRTRKYAPKRRDEYGSEIEFVFANDLRKAFSEVENLPKSVVHTLDDALDGIDFVTGARGRKDVDLVKEFLKDLYDSKVVGLDYETNCLRPYMKGAKILSVAVADKYGSLSFPLYHRQSAWSKEHLEEVLQAFEDFLYEAPCRKVAHSLSFELEWSAFFFGREVVRAGKWGDSLSQAYILDERIIKGKPGCHSLEFLSIQYFGINIKAIDNLDRRNLDAVSVDQVLRYNALDAKYHRLLYNVQSRRLREEGLSKVYAHQLRRVPTMVLTQYEGLPVDREAVKRFDEEYTRKLSDIEEKVSKLKVVRQFEEEKDKGFRPSANEDILYVLRNILRKSVESTDERVLNGINHEFTRLIGEWRSANKIHSTYVKPLKLDSPHIFDDGKLHPVISVTKTRTWRTSSEDPNIQNFPKRKNREVRSQIKPGGDLKMVSFDYGQIQARNVAMESKDKALVEAFWNRYDIHSDWLEKIVKVYPKFVDGGPQALNDKKVRKLHRNKAKNEFVFPSFFGAQAKSLAKYLGLPQNIAQDLSDEFWDMFPDIKNWHELMIKNYYKTGYVTGLSGFRRHAPISPNELINAPIQADEAIIVCDAMNRLSELDDPRFQAVLEVHDDLTFIWPRKEVEKNAEVVIQAMLDVPFEWAHIVPIVVEMSVGDDWASTEDVGEFSSDLWDGKLNLKDKAI